LTRRGRRLLGIAGILVVGIALGGVLLLTGVTSASDPAENAGLTVAREQMVWAHGPSVVSRQAISLSDLPAALHRSVSPRVVSDVNVPGLIRRYGAHRKIVLVVMTGEYNSLPPDEGIEVNGEAIAIVDAHTNHVLLLMN
jgi:hypothetical protein